MDRYGRLEVIGKSGVTDKIKRSFFVAAIGSILLYGCTNYMDANLMYGEKAWQQLHKNAANNIEQVLEVAPNKAAAVRPPTTHQKTIQVRRAREVIEKWGRTHLRHTPVDPFAWMSKCRLAC